jgi:photosystem II stability/assembly factor-like uncharacterized protein
VPQQPQGQQGWVQETTNTQAIITNICWGSSDTVFAIGDSSLLRSTDAGSTWIHVASPLAFRGAFFDTEHGYLQAGHNCYHTSNGGKDWITTNDSAYNSPIYAIAADTALAGGAFRTSDGGNTWRSVIAASVDITSLAFYDNRIGFMVGGIGIIGYYYSTTNSGLTWQQGKSYNSSSSQSLSPVYVSLDTILVVGDIGFARRTVDGGVTWDSVGKPTYPTTYGIGAVAYRAGRILAVGTSGAIFTSLDAGFSWQKENSGIGTELTTIAMMNDSLALTGGVGGEILKTTNGGTDWVQVFPPAQEEFVTQTFPQPATGVVNFVYTLPQLQDVTIRVYDITGNEFATIVRKQLQQAGSHTLPFDASRYPAGVYSYSVQTERFHTTGKFTLVK